MRVYAEERRDIQRVSTDWVVNRKASALWLTMGAGKTTATLEAMAQLMDRVEVANWLVVSTPRICGSVWRDECATWREFNWLTSRCLTAEDLPTAKVDVIRKGQPTKVFKLVNPRQLKANIYRMTREYHFLTCPADLLPRLVKLFGDDWPFDGVVMDESSLFKNYDTDRVKAIRRVRNRIDWLVQLTGTPSPKGLEQLWSQIYILDGGERLGRTLTDFRERYMRPARNDKGREIRDGSGTVLAWEDRPGAMDEILERIRDIVLSLDVELGIPEPVLVFSKIAIPASAAARYRELQDEFILEVADKIIEAPTAAALSGKLRQLANGFGYDVDGQAVRIHDSKLEALKEIIDTTPGQVLVAYEFTEDRRRIREKFPKAVFLDECPDFEAAWNRGEIGLGVMHASQGAHGLNLQHGGNVAVWFGVPWDLEVYLQWNRRLARPGQKETVFIHHLVAEGTIEEYVVVPQLNRKEARQETLVQGVRQMVQDRLNQMAIG